MSAFLARVICMTFWLALVSSFPPPFQAQTYTVLHNFSGGADGASPYAGITIDAAGNLEGTALAGGLGYGTVFRLELLSLGTMPLAYCTTLLAAVTALFPTTE